MHHRPPGNCNYGGVFIIWDRLFGTFKEEKKKRDFYGLGNQLNTFNPIYPNYQHAIRMLNIDLAEQSNDAPRTSPNRPVTALFNRAVKFITRRRVHHPLKVNPSAILAGMPSPLPEEVGPSPSGRIKFGANLHLPLAVRIYSSTHFLLALVQSVFMLKVGHDIPYEQLVVHVTVVFVSLVSISMLNEAHPLSRTMEWTRVSILATSILAAAASPDAKAVLLPYLPLRLDLSPYPYFWCAQALCVSWAATCALCTRHFISSERKNGKVV